MLRTGILLPRSTLFPALGLDILNGIKENCKQQKIFDDIKLVTDNIGFGLNEGEIYAKAEKMLLQDDADIVILCADTRIAEMLQPLFTASNKILLVVNLGANFPENWQAAPTTITHSLNFCLHAGLTGKLAAAGKGKEVVNAISYYDGGYNQCYCMLSSHHANGGIPAYNHVTNINNAEFTLEPMAAFLEEHPKIKTMLCLFAGDQAELFYRDISPLQKKFGLRLYVSPMLFEPSLKNSLGDDFTIDHVQGYIPWHSSLKNEANKKFNEIFSSAGGTQANYFSLLGWETGMIISEIYRQHQSGNTNATKVICSLEGIAFDSPRGWMKIDPETHHSYGPSWLGKCKNNMKVTVGKELANSEEEWKRFTRETSLKGESSTWRNTYLCI